MRDERQYNLFLDRKRGSDFLLLLKQGIYRLLPSLRQLLNSACNSAQNGSDVKLQFTFFECFFPFCFTKLLEELKNNLGKNFTWNCQKFGLCMKWCQEDSKHLKLAQISKKTSLITWAKTAQCFSLAPAWIRVLWSSNLQFKILGNLTVKRGILLLPTPILCETSRVQLRWTSRAFLLRRVTDSSGGNGFKTNTKSGFPCLLISCGFIHAEMLVKIYLGLFALSSTPHQG